jgi:hypothetical protein
LVSHTFSTHSSTMWPLHSLISSLSFTCLYPPPTIGYTHYSIFIPNLLLTCVCPSGTSILQLLCMLREQCHFQLIQHRFDLHKYEMGRGVKGMQ